jgi:hypothetical protein
MTRGQKMLKQEATPELVESWKKTWREYKDRLHPNRKSGAEVAAYLRKNYPTRELSDEKTSRMVALNVLENEVFAVKLPEGAEPLPVCFIIEDIGEGKRLYENRDEVFKDGEILIGIDLSSGCFFVEGSSLLWDELFVFQGLDERDINNYFYVAEYISCLEKFGTIERAIN